MRSPAPLDPDAFAGPRPHVCFVAPTTWPLISGARDIPVVGGAEVQQSLVAPALAARGWRVSMITLDYGQPDHTEVKGVSVHRLYRPDAGIPVFRFIHPRLTKLWQVLQRVGADVYYSRSAAPLAGFLAAFARTHGCRSVYSGASDVDFVPGREDITFARDRWIFQYGVGHADQVFVQNGNQAEQVHRNYRRSTALVPNCYHPPEGAHASRDGYVLWVATIRSPKRPDLLLEMARRLPRQRFVVVGGADIGPKGQEELRQFKNGLANLPNVEYRGFVPFQEADRMFDGARLLVNTSAYEGFPNTFLQAWARGVPTVAFVDTGSRHNGEPAYDIVSDMTAATARVERLMRDDAAWEAASARVKAHFRAHHSLDAVIDVYERELAAVWRSGRGGRA